MGYIHAVNLPDNQTYLIEPLLFATAGGDQYSLTAGISNFTLVSGAYVNIKINDVGANATLNVNNTGDKDIYYNGVAISANMLTSGHIYTFIYDGLKWNVLGDIVDTNVMIGTTQEWQQRYSYVAPKGNILIYTDHGTVQINSTTVTVPGVKITDGSTPAADLPFVGDDVIIPLRQELEEHIRDNIRHITAEERAIWNNKITCENTVQNNNLVLTRN